MSCRFCKGNLLSSALDYLAVTTKPKAGWRRGRERGSESMVSSFPDLGGSPSTGLKGNSSMSINNTLYFYKLLNYKLKKETKICFWTYYV